MSVSFARSKLARSAREAFLFSKQHAVFIAILSRRFKRISLPFSLSLSLSLSLETVLKRKEERKKGRTVLFSQVLALSQLFAIRPILRKLELFKPHEFRYNLSLTLYGDRETYERGGTVDYTYAGSR